MLHQPYVLLFLFRPIFLYVKLHNIFLKEHLFQYIDFLRFFLNLNQYNVVDNIVYINVYIFDDLI
jgi:hypothetical protein